MSKEKKEPLIDDAKLKAFLRIKPTLADTAAFFECSERSVERYIRDNYDVTFVEFRDQNMVHTRHALIRKAIELALKGNTAMLIFSLKNLCGWKDKNEDPDAPVVPITLAYDPTKRITANK